MRGGRARRGRTGGAILELLAERCETPDLTVTLTAAGESFHESANGIDSLLGCVVGGCRAGSQGARGGRERRSSNGARAGVGGVNCSGVVTGGRVGAASGALMVVLGGLGRLRGAIALGTILRSRLCG